MTLRALPRAFVPPCLRAFFSVCLPAFLAFVVLSCERPTPAPPQPHAATRPTLRIAALSPAIAVILRDLGHADAIVARHGFDAWSNQALPVAGDQQGFDYETLLRVNPTHVLVQWGGGGGGGGGGGRDLPARLSQLARERGWLVQDLPLLTLADIERAAASLHTLTTPNALAWTDTPLAARMKAAWAPRTPSLAPAGRVLLLYGTNPPTAIGPGSFHHQLLERLGGTPAITSGSPFMQLDVEDVLRIAPDCIVLVRPADATPASSTPGPQWRIVPPEEFPATLGPLAKHPIPAITQRRVGILTDPLAAIPGTNLITLADDLGALLEAISGPG
ncbi:MAG: ABC transporter substrate-binding protein [Phycisphaerales bacterium]